MAGSNPTLDAAIELMLSHARKSGNESLMTTDPDGNILICIGANEADKVQRIQGCAIQMAMKEPTL